MRHLVTEIFAMFICLAFISCNKDKDNDVRPFTPDPSDPKLLPEDGACRELNPDAVQYAFILCYTATWCPPCGSYQAPMIQNACDVFPGRVIVVSAHENGDPMYLSALCQSLKNDRPNDDVIPAQWVGDIQIGSSNIISVTQNLLSNPIVAALDYDITRSEQHLRIQSQVRFFQDVTGPFYLSTYAIESGIDGSSSAGPYMQLGTLDPDYTHDYVLRASATIDAYGELVADTAVLGQRFNQEYILPADTGWGPDVYVVSVLWRLDTSTVVPHYKYVNGFLDKAKVH